MSVPLPPVSSWQSLLDLALAEDLGSGDVTSTALIPEHSEATARVEARQPMRLCGLPIVEDVFAGVDPDLEFHSEANEGADVKAGPVLRVRGSLRSILAAERTALNFLGRLSGIATLTQRYVAAVGDLPCRVVDTRKTLPGWRVLDKYATAVGGAENHRFGLFDALLLKDNHLAFAGGAAAAFRVARERAPSHLRIQVEVENEQDAAEAVAAGADWLLLDNCAAEVLRSIAARFGARALLEASGGIHLETVRAVAETGVHRISVGALTHSAPVADVALELDEVRE